MSGNSKVGTSAVYEAGDQRNVKRSEQDTSVPYEEGKVNSHKLTDPSKWLPTTLIRQLPVLTSVQRTSGPLPTVWPPRRYDDAGFGHQTCDWWRRANSMQRQGETPDDKETAQLKKDPTLPVSASIQDATRVHALTGCRPRCTATSLPRAPRLTPSCKQRTSRGCGRSRGNKCITIDVYWHGR